MSRGGARNRSGPQPSEDSGRSDARGYSLTALPAEGYAGDIPNFPLPDETERETAVWAEVWRTPQACAWSMPAERWRIPTVAMWVRVRVACESHEVTASMLGQLHRFADQVGMTTAGLAEMGWKVSTEQPVTAEPATPEGESAPPEPRRLRAVGGV